MKELSKHYSLKNWLEDQIKFHESKEKCANIYCLSYYKECLKLVSQSERQVGDSLLDDIIEVIIEHATCHHDAYRDEDGGGMTSEYDIDDEEEVKKKLKKLLVIEIQKPKVPKEFVEKHRKLLILMIVKMEEKKLLDWTDEGASLKILEANFDNFIKETIEAIPVEVEE